MLSRQTTWPRRSTGFVAVSVGAAVDWRRIVHPAEVIATRHASRYRRWARSRPFTRTAALLTGGHILYELLAGVGVPLAPHVGVAPAAGLFATGTFVAVRESGRRGADDDPAFCALNGLFLAAVVGHFRSWPGGSRAGLPWLRECEGLRGPVLQPYNALLHLSWIAAVGGLIENRRGRRWGALVPTLVVPLLVRATPGEYARLREQARDRPRWWNRRLQD